MLHYFLYNSNSLVIELYLYIKTVCWVLAFIPKSFFLKLMTRIYSSSASKCFLNSAFMCFITKYIYMFCFCNRTLSDNFNVFYSFIIHNYLFFRFKISQNIRLLYFCWIDGAIIGESMSKLSSNIDICRPG